MDNKSIQLNSSLVSAIKKDFGSTIGVVEMHIVGLLGKMLTAMDAGVLHSSAA